jgi:hypothetical protein
MTAICAQRTAGVDVNRSFQFTTADVEVGGKLPLSAAIEAVQHNRTLKAF